MSEKLVSLGFAKPGDSRKEIGVELLIQGDDRGVEVAMTMSEHEFLSLLSGTVVRLQNRVEES